MQVSARVGSSPFAFSCHGWEELPPHYRGPRVDGADKSTSADMAFRRILALVGNFSKRTAEQLLYRGYDFGLVTLEETTDLVDNKYASRVNDMTEIIWSSSNCNTSYTIKMYFLYSVLVQITLLTSRTLTFS